MSGIDAVHVVVPARNEEALIGRCLESLASARAALLRQRPGFDVRVTVVLDGCVDGTAAVVAGVEGVDALAVTELTPGGARAAGVRRVRDLHGDAQRVWVACTDADSVVPPGWLTGQLRCAETGAVCRVGVVRPALSAGGQGLHLAWLARHELGEDHRHVFGANLGFSLTAYEQVGGFAPLGCGEDVDLVRRLREAGLPVLASGADPVLTSDRRSSRVRGGFADYLATLVAELASVT